MYTSEVRSSSSGPGLSLLIALSILCGGADLLVDFHGLTLLGLTDSGRRLCLHVLVVEPGLDG